MNAEHIKPFVQGTQAIMASVCGENMNVGKMFVKAHPYKCEHAAISVQISGDVKGNVIYTMAEGTALAAASKMMGGMPVAGLDDMSRSALEELANMISSQAAMLFSGMGLKVSVTAPVFHVNAGEGSFPFLQPDSKLICIPLTCQDGSVFEVDLLLI